MLSNPGVGGATNDLLEMVGPEIRASLAASRRILDEAAWLRASSGRLDSPLEDRERTLRDKPPRGRKLRGMLTQCSEAVVEANEVHGKVLNKELEALPLFRQALEGIVALAKGDSGIPTGAIETLEECARLRGEAIEWRERALRSPGGVLEMGENGTAEQLLALLEERRRLLSEARSRERKAERLERRAIRRSDGGAEIEVKPEREEAPAPVLEAKPPPKVKPARRSEKLSPGQGLLRKIAELEDELSLALRRAEADRAEAARSSEERIRRIEALHESSFTREKEARRAAEERIEDLEEEHLAVLTRLEESEGENEGLTRRLGEAEQAARAERSAHEAESSLARDRIEVLTRRRDFLKQRVLATKRLQVAGARDAAEEGASLRARLAEARDSASTDRAAIEAERQAAEGKLTEMKACLEELERRVDDLKSTEEELARERDEVGERLADAERRMSEAEERLAKESEHAREAHQERNEALALASSLIRRLEGEGASEDEIAPAKSIAGELGNVLAEIGAQKSELESLKEQLDTYRSELTAQLDSIREEG